jgi:hypothetical protein
VKKTTIALLFIGAFASSLAAGEDAYPLESSIPRSLKPALHFAIPCAVSWGSCELLYRCDKNIPYPGRVVLNASAGILTGIAITIVKEQLDRSLGYSADADDIVIGTLGALSGAGFYLLHEFSIKHRSAKEKAGHEGAVRPPPP